MEESTEPTQSEFGALQVRWLALWILGALMLMTYVAMVLLPDMGVEKSDPIVAYASMAILYSAVAVWMAVSFNKHRIDVRRLVGDAPNPQDLRLSLGVVAAALMLTVALMTLLYVRIPTPIPDPDAEPSLGMGTTQFPDLLNAFSIFVMVIIGPVVEEFLFRGVLIHRLSAKWGRRAAIFYSSLFFGLLHPDIIGKFVFGLLLAKLYLKTRSLHVPIFCHMLNNGLAVVAGLGGIGQTSENATAIFGVLRDNPWIGLSCLAVSFPLVLYFLNELETPPETPLPYDTAPGAADA